MAVQSSLPESFEEETIEGMSPGDSGYTVFWAMWADSNRALWINGAYTINKKPDGTVQMKIERTKDGVIVYQKTIDGRYSIGERPAWNPDRLPVILR